MPITKKIYTNVELDWAEEQLLSWKEYVDSHPLHEMTDRIAYKELKGGGTMPVVVATIEQQGKFIRETMRDYLSLLKEVESMREKDAAKQVEAKGDSAVPYRMQKVKGGV